MPLLNRRDWLRRVALGCVGATLPLGFSSEVAAIGPRSRFAVARLQYEGGLWEPREFASSKMLLEVEKRTSISIEHKSVVLAPDDPAIFEHAFLLLSGDRGFPPFSEQAVHNLSIYLRAGGFLLIDSSEGSVDGEFDRSVRREMKKIFPEEQMVSVDRGHVVYRSFYLLKGEEPWGRFDLSREFEGIAQGDRFVVLYSKNDLQGAWARNNFGVYTYHDVLSRQREYSYRYGVNLVMYALCINYKADQVHIDFILNRRDWTIPDE